MIDPRPHCIADQFFGLGRSGTRPLPPQRLPRQDKLKEFFSSLKLAFPKTVCPCLSLASWTAWLIRFTLFFLLLLFFFALLFLASRLLLGCGQQDFKMKGIVLFFRCFYQILKLIR